MQKSKYSFAEKLLHKLALGSHFIAEMSFDIDQLSLGESAPRGLTERRHIFIAGLARAGTTILLRNFYATGRYRSLTYNDMPFVLAPNLWGRLASAFSRKIESEERAHGDQLLIDAESPESLDEVFWRVFSGNEYIYDSYLTPHSPNDAISKKYVDYVTGLLNSASSESDLYLCKNNNNLLRLGTISRTFPKALILIPFRNPVEHADSLRAQHKNFVGMQGTDRFVFEYFNWLGHHEFGLGHRPFRFANSQVNPFEKESLNYWLLNWCETYDWLLKNKPDTAIFVCYEHLCNDKACWESIAKLAGITSDLIPQTAFNLRKRKTEKLDIDSSLEDRARHIYGRLQRLNTY